jgi:hypothetical protein
MVDGNFRTGGLKQAGNQSWEFGVLKKGPLGRINAWLLYLDL